jgi:hypothetical protein
VDAESPWFMETFDENAFSTDLHMQVDAHASAKNLESIKVHQPGIEAAWNTTAVAYSYRVNSLGGVVRILIAMRRGGE